MYRLYGIKITAIVIRPKNLSMCFPLHLKNANAKCGNMFYFSSLGRKKGKCGK